MNDLGYYRGGVPRKNRGTIRGDALGPAGEFHSPQLHNFMHYDHPDSYRVTPEDAIKFKHFMGSDRADFERTKPAHPMHYDRDFNYRKDRSYWLRLLLSMSAVIYLTNRYHLEQDRARMTARLEGYKNIPGHHFNNRGGVIVLKDFVGFEKYYQNGDRMDKWYYKVYKGFHY